MTDWPEKLTAVVAAYAAAVSTAALALEIRRWFESGPRLTLTIMADARFVGGPIPDHKEYLSARVTSRGTQTTTVTNFAVQEFSSPFQAWLRRPSKAAIVPIPRGIPLPHVLQPGTEWTGAVAYDADLTAWAATGKLYVAIFTSDRRRPLIRRVVRRPNEVGAEEQ